MPPTNIDTTVTTTIIQVQYSSRVLYRKLKPKATPMHIKNMLLFRKIDSMTDYILIPENVPPILDRISVLVGTQKASKNTNPWYDSSMLHAVTFLVGKHSIVVFSLVGHFFTQTVLDSTLSPKVGLLKKRNLYYSRLFPLTLYPQELPG